MKGSSWKNSGHGNGLLAPPPPPQLDADAVALHQSNGFVIVVVVTSERSASGGREPPWHVNASAPPAPQPRSLRLASTSSLVITGASENAHGVWVWPLEWPTAVGVIGTELPADDDEQVAAAAAAAARAASASCADMARRRRRRTRPRRWWRRRTRGGTVGTASWRPRWQCRRHHHRRPA